MPRRSELGAGWYCRVDLETGEASHERGGDQAAHKLVQMSLNGPHWKFCVGFPRESGIFECSYSM